MELSRTRDIVRRIDPAAFLSIIDTREVEGKAFISRTYYREELMQVDLIDT